MRKSFGWAENLAQLDKLPLREVDHAIRCQLQGGDACAWLAAMNDGKVSCVDLVCYCLSQIKKYDRKLNAMISINPNVLEEARQCDLLRSKGVQMPLLGLPVVIKDNINVQGLPTTQGAKALCEAFPKEDAELVLRLRAAGAVIVGKASLSEYASSGMSDNSLIGQTRNPYDLTRTPGGSSGGSGVAVAMEYAAFGIGTDGVNSVRSPASANALVGLRPTKGGISLQGITPSSQTQDMAGILARSARDAMLVFRVISSVALQETAGTEGSEPTEPIFFEAKRHGLRGKRIALLRNNCGNDEAVLAVVEDTVCRLKSAGAEVIECTDDVLDSVRMLKENNVIRYEQKENIDSWLSNPANGNTIHSLEEYLDSGTVCKDVEKTLLTELNPQYSRSSTEYRERMERIANNRVYLREKMREEKLDAFCYPSQMVPVVTVGDPRGQLGRNGILASCLGIPAVSFPGGFTAPTEDAPQGIPVGMEFLGAAGSERLLLDMAESFEQNFAIRKAPLASMLCEQ